MADNEVNLSILSNISLWYQDPEVSELFYSFLRDSWHSQNPDLRLVIKLQ